LEFSVLSQQDQFTSFSTRIQAGLLRRLAGWLSWTWRVEFKNRDLLDGALGSRGAVLAFWHGEQLPMVPLHAHLGLVGMASQSRDGDLLAEIIRGFGFGVIRGSSRRGGARAVRQAVRGLERCISPVLAVDGPRGPRRVVQPGAAAIASLASVPVVYGVAWASHAIRLRTWDRFQIPLPGARVVVAYGKLNEAGDAVGVEALSDELQRRMISLGQAIIPSNGGL